MIRIYYLETELIDNTEVVKGAQYIHNAWLGIEDSLRKLIQDTTDAEHTGLIALAVSWREPTTEEIAIFNGLPPPVSPEELLADQRMAELRALLKQGAHVIVSKPPTGDYTGSR